MLTRLENQLSVAHHFKYLWRTPGPGGCATDISPLKYISVAHVPGAPQKVQLSVAHRAACATEMCGLGVTLAYSVAHGAACATDIGAPQKFWAMRHRYLEMNFFLVLYKYRYIQYTIVIHIYTDIMLNLTGK